MLSPSSEGVSSVESKHHEPYTSHRKDERRHTIGERPTRQPQQLVGSSIRVLPTVPPIHIICLVLSRVFGSINIEHAIELSKHQAEYASGYAQRGTEDDTDVPHGHPVQLRVLDDQDEMSSESPEETVVGDRQ